MSKAVDVLIREYLVARAVRLKLAGLVAVIFQLAQRDLLIMQETRQAQRRAAEIQAHVDDDARHVRRLKGLQRALEHAHQQTQVIIIGIDR